MNTIPVFPLKLEETYYKKGFFNVKRDWDHLVRTTNGPVTLILDGFGEIEARVNRRANMNGTARIYGNAPLRDWFQREYSQGQTVLVTFERPDRLKLG